MAALARSHHRRGEAESSVQVGSQAVQLAEALGDEGYETRVVALLMVATDSSHCGRLEQAEASLEQAERDWKRVSALFGQQSVTRAEYDAAQSRNRLAKGAAAEAKVMMS